MTSNHDYDYIPLSKQISGLDSGMQVAMGG